MKKKSKTKNSSTTNLGEINLLIRVKIINSFNLNEEVFLQKYFCDRETLFMVCLPSFKKTVREKADVKFISLYLSNLKKFINLLKTINEDNKDNNNNNVQKQNEEKDKYFKLLRYVSEHLIYEKYESKRLVMRYGDIGDKFYIILHGLVSIIIPIRISMQLTFNEFSRYIARLILFQEYELAKITMRENKHIYNIDLPDIKFIIHYINKNSDESINEKEDYRNYYSGIKSAKNVFRQTGKNLMKYITTKIEEVDENNYKNKNKINFIRNIKIEKMIENENATKIERFMSKYLTKEEYKSFEDMKERDSSFDTDDENDKMLSSETYISRIKNFKLVYDNNYQLRKKSSHSQSQIFNSAPSRKSSKKINFGRKEKDKEKEETDNYENLQATHNKNTVYIYEYQEIIQLETGDIFGDFALSNNSSKRTATVISLMDSYFGCLNRDIYNAIKGSNEKKKKNMVNYLCHTKIFRSINYKTLEDKYLNYFAFKNAFMDEYIIKNGQVNTNLIIIKNGTFEVFFSGSLKDFYNIMNYYRDNFSDLDERKYEFSDSLFRKIYKINDNMRKIEKLFGENKDTIYEHKLLVIHSSSIFGLKETEKLSNNEYISFFDIKCTSSEGEYVLLDKRIFYRQIYGPDFKVKEETKLYIKEFAEKAINRLIHILYGKIWNILTKNDMKIYKNIKKVSLSAEESKINFNLIQEIGLDFHYMNKYNLTDIECIIEKIFSMYTEDAFDYRILGSNLHNFFENEKRNSVQEKNMIKLEDEQYDIKKFNAFFKLNKSKEKKHYTKLSNLKRHNSILNRRENMVVKNNKKQKILNFDSNINNKKNKIPKILNYDNNINNKNNINKKRRDFFTPFSANRNRSNKKIKFKLDKSISSFSEEKNYEISPNKRNSNNLLLNKNSYYYYQNSNIAKNKNNEFSKNFSSGLSQGKTLDSFVSDVSVNCNYANFNNACISKINYTLKKNKSVNDFETINSNNRFLKSKYNNLIDFKMNHMFGGNEKYKSLYNRCFSARHNNNSRINIFDTNQLSKEIYVEQRKDYILKNTRALFTRNKNFVQYKRKKKMVDKNV